jgi:SAM-dependent methyltransferase
MSIGNLIKFKERVKNNIDLSEVSIAINKKLNRVLAASKEVNNAVLEAVILEKCTKQMTDFSNLIQTASTSLLSIINEIDIQINNKEKVLLAQIPPRRSYVHLSQYDTFRYSESAEQLLISRISKYSSWQYPAMEINPRHPAKITTKMVASDPLYIVDFEYEEMISDTLSIFTPEYQARLRPYFIKNYEFSSLPKEQLGFIISVNSFEYLPIAIIKSVLISIYPLLLPGGTFLFTYNNCEIPENARLAEDNTHSYVTQSFLSNAAIELGYEVAETFNILDGQPLSWIELKKPGTLKTIKGHQTLGEIKDIE